MKNRIRLARRPRGRLGIGGVLPPFSIDDIAILIRTGFEREDLRPDTLLTLGSDQGTDTSIGHPAVEVPGDADVAGGGVLETNDDLSRWTQRRVVLFLAGCL